jgi:membrane protein implicated in regulation of membrane protease activity
MNLVLWLRVILFLLLVVLPAYRFVRTLRLRRQALMERVRGSRVNVDESRVVDSTLVEREDEV